MQRIDVHCHVVTPSYRQYAINHGHDHPDGMPDFPVWSPEAHIALMEKLDIDKSILSISSPGTHLTPGRDEEAVRMTRQFNEELSGVCRLHYSHLAFFASLPIPCVEGSVAEIDHALNVLGAVGFAVLSNANGVYLGDKTLDPVFAKLNERKAVVLIHPTISNVSSKKGDGSGSDDTEATRPLPQYPGPMMEFMFDETRVVANLLLSGTVARYPNITYIMSHSGCALPSLVDRIGGFAAIQSGVATEMNQGGEKLCRLLRERFYFDLAGFPFPNQVHGLLRVLGEGGEKRLLYATDWPFTPEKVAVSLTEQMDKGCEGLFDEDQRSSIYSGNANKLFNFT
ncbi:Decarboxylase yanB [Apiospora arundinis]|uniref:6-methylsalicylate decarboxylase n=1 Tax=Apiospora arundinis TaxID=335852 RepID=A0ABR2I309_9PEZI